MGFHISRVRWNDVLLLQQISRQTFTESFSEDNAEADMIKYLEKSFAEEKLASELNNPNTEFYFAGINEEIVGYIKINFGEAQTEKMPEDSMEIERIYVLSSFHGKKIGQHLFEYVKQIARDKNIQFIWLGVWEKNTKAIQFYQKNGFEVIGKHLFKLGDDEQTDLIMRLEVGKPLQ